jgi:hypothetical protein
VQGEKHKRRGLNSSTQGTSASSARTPRRLAGESGD